MTDEIKRDVEILHERGCRGCVVKEVTTCAHREKGGYCNNFYHEAADMIESLVEKLDKAEREKNEAWNIVERLNKQIELMAGALERVKQERDAAIADISRQCNKCKNFKIMFNGCTPDYDCKYSDVCEDGNHWEWRGVIG